MARVTRTFVGEDGEDIRIKADEDGDVWFTDAYDEQTVFVTQAALNEFLIVRPDMVELAQDK